ncbi:AAA family ATPase [Rhabdochromatium marinum]|uniref:AAA family ATPase n=1 Tax=Rhabdochromatium marinum TaxID=48729 RepID=UPI001907096E|nr:AAA family ATPase [Rhabdochromatium marinum]MBK1648153.1 hypothetical protein [Rhabdochromatium marinum]
MRFPYGLANFQAIVEEGYLQEDAIASFRSLLAAITETPHRLYLLIDEYDNFANEVLVSHQQGEGRYQELVGGEGAIKTLFKAVKDAAEGRGLDRVFITGVSPLVLADITSGYNVVEDISSEPDYADLCGFHEEECHIVLPRTRGRADLQPDPGAVFLQTSDRAVRLPSGDAGQQSDHGSQPHRIHRPSAPRRGSGNRRPGFHTPHHH